MARVEIPWPMMKWIERTVAASEGAFETVDEFVRSSIRTALLASARDDKRRQH